MRWCDETTISKARIPGLLLMDRAGTAAAHLILNSYPPSSDASVAVVCGKGNNGGDGFVIARVLADHGYQVVVVLTGTVKALAGDAAKQCDILRRVARLPGSDLRIVTFASFVKERHAGFSVVVDAVFGTGFQGAPRGVPKRAIEWMRGQRSPVVAVDIPSGIDATTGTASGSYVPADMTVTFGLIKTGLLLNEGRENAGHVVCVDIGIPNGVVRTLRNAVHLVEHSDIRALLPRRPRRLHKYAAGKVLVLAGSPGYTGAANLASHGALRAGAGAVMLMTPDSIYPIMARKRTDEIVQPVPSGNSGTFGPASVQHVIAKLAWADVVLIGPGLSLNEETTRFVEAILTERKGPVVIDADALTIVARSRSLRAKLRTHDWILTPHTGEFDRFVSLGSHVIEQNRISSARTFVRSMKSTLVLKGAPTLVAAGDGQCYLNATGNPGMATVGSGDVLAGCIAALRAQGLDSPESSYAGAYLHGRAGDLASDVLGERSMTASDLLQYLPVAIREFGQ